MRKISNAIRPQAFGLKTEYHSDGGWIQFFPAEKKAIVAYFTEAENGNLLENVIIIKKGEEVEFTPTEYNWETRRSVYEITIR